MVTIINENEKISWNSNDYFLVREGQLISIDRKHYNLIELDEKYCVITQTPSTPPDFGLVLKEKKEPLIFEGIKYPFNDVEIQEVIDFMLINPIYIKQFILQEVKFVNYWEY